GGELLGGGLSVRARHRAEPKLGKAIAMRSRQRAQGGERVVDADQRKRSQGGRRLVVAANDGRRRPRSRRGKEGMAVEALAAQGYDERVGPECARFRAYADHGEILRAAQLAVDGRGDLAEGKAGLVSGRVGAHRLESSASTRRASSRSSKCRRSVPTIW